MASISLTQAEADALMEMGKRRVDDEEWSYPGPGVALTIPLLDLDGREPFLLDLRRGRLNLAKGTYQNRARNVIVLARLDFGGPPHRNPDDEEIGSPHLHLYREGYDDKWAYPVPDELRPNLDDPLKTLGSFMRYCHIVEPPIVQRGLFG